tara:strand:- start:208 stop:405 length:198 start_codon:yes stop_codon:yes gene_type:complete
MNVRDYFAGQALGATIRGVDETPSRAGQSLDKICEGIAKRAWTASDAMMKERAKRQKQRGDVDTD